MPTYTSFLGLTLPAFSEFVDSWHEPMNQNSEDLDDWMLSLHNNLVGTGATAGTGAEWSSLRGNLDSLAVRVNKAIDADGQIDVSGSQDILDMSVSAYKGDLVNPRDRLNDGDREVFEAGQPVAGGKFDSYPSSGLSAGYPQGVDAGIALRSADFGAPATATTTAPMSGPAKPWAPGLVIGGPSNIVQDNGISGQVVITANSKPTIFNIDGYLFRLRESILLDYSALTGLSLNNYVWVFVERDDASYNAHDEFKYSESPGGTPVRQDLRVMKSGTGNTSTLTPTVFEDLSGSFDTLPFKVKEGDILRILSGTSAGDYVIDALDIPSSNTKLTIKGVFSGSGSAPYEIRDHAMPNIGVAIAASSPNLATSRPPQVDGRVYIGRFYHETTPDSDTFITFTRGGVYDSGWIVNPFVTVADVETFQHNLGAIPSKVEIWVRENDTAQAHRPLVLRQVVTDGATTADLLLPSMWHRSDELETRVALQNATTTPAKVSALFTKDVDTAPADVLPADAGSQMRIVAWR